jgi:hypothetical protein
MELYKEDIRNTNHTLDSISRVFAALENCFPHFHNAASSGAVDGGGKTGGGKVIRSC